MSTSRVIISILVIVLCLGAGLAAGIGYGYLKLGEQEKVFTAKIKEVNQRLANVQRRSAEDKNLQSNLENEKQEIQAKAEGFEKTIKGLNAENQGLKSKLMAQETQKAALETKIAALTLMEKKIPPLETKAAALETKTAALEEKNAELANRLSKTEGERNTLSQKLKETAEGLKNSEKDLAQVRSERRKLEIDLTGMTQRNSQCEAGNARLYIIAEELIAKYKKKGVMDAFSQNEPITQIGKVELERLGNEYKDKIEKEKVKKP